jgi:general secretion pathway protein G
MTAPRVPRRVAGFSLIELIAAAAILGVLATVAVPVVETTVKRQKEQDLRVALRDIRNALDAYKQAVANNRIEARMEESGYPPSLTVLIAGVEDKQNKSGPRLYFLRRIPRDPFSSKFSATAAETWGLRSHESPPEAPRTGVDVFDVYSTSALTGLNGIPYSEW